MSSFKLNESQLARKLDRLPLLLRVIFAATCAEGLLPAYITFSELTKKGDPEILARILTRLWEDIAGDLMTESEVQVNIGICMDLVPEDDNETLAVGETSAEDASVAVGYALTCRQNGNIQAAIWSARRTYSALDHFVINRENIDLKPLGAEARIRSHPLLQAELARQCRDIDELLGAANEDVRQTAARFRDRAKAEGKIFFGAPS